MKPAFKVGIRTPAIFMSHFYLLLGWQDLFGGGTNLWSNLPVESHQALFFYFFLVGTAGEFYFIF